MQIYGLIYIPDNNEPQLFALQNVSVEANIKICQTYKNTTSETIEALYKFPIYENSAIYEFEAEIDGDRKIKGIVHEAKEAAEKYKEAVAAYLLEEELSDTFQCSVGNLTPQQTVVIKITYISELKHDLENERIRFVLPTRLLRDMVRVPGNESPVLNATLTVEVTCRMKSMITSIESPSHLITTELTIGGDNKVAKIQLAEDVSYLEKDFVLVVKTDIIIDRSGSMSGDPIKKAKEALELILRSLPEDCIFNVVSFVSKFTSLFPESNPCTEETFKKALDHANGQVYNVFQIVNLISDSLSKRNDPFFANAARLCSISSCSTSPKSKISIFQDGTSFNRLTDETFQSSKEFYKYFDDSGDKNNNNLKKSIPKVEEKNKLIKEKIWTTSIDIKYLEIELFPKFKEEKEKVNWALEKAEEWITKWVNES
ncbi:11743_t:CDS:10 [Diversispora eburnea]|uniref:11743_t:CDS:1 n=1 Tax=Diversispora eburnea TaxID=1213867 RepID=A0A9N8VTT5_9GLOM|nr:11743_t:CDS:10 [Diversispora eburnea]